MTKTRFPILIIIVISMLIPAVSQADDLVLVDLKNKFQAEVLTGIAGHAKARDGNSFVVSLSASQLAQVDRAGLEYSMLLEGIEAESTYLVLARRRGLVDRTVLSELGTVVSLRRGSYVASLSRIAASNLADSPDYFVRPLEEMQIRIAYAPRAVANLLSQLTNFPSDSLADRVNQDSIYAFNTRLEAFQTRYVYQQDSINAARDWMVQKFQDWGYQVTTPSFWYNSTQMYNV